VLNWPRLSVLQWCLAGSVAVHAALLGFRFVDPAGFDKIFKDTGLEVILVNTKTNDNNQDAKAIAQTSLVGGGEANKGRASSPLQADLQDASGDATEDVQQRLEQMQSTQNMLLGQLRNALSKAAAAQKAETDPPDSEQQKTRQRLKQFAEIEKQVVQENERPKKRVVSPSTVGKVHALYYQNYKSKVEALGTRNFPSLAGQKLYGDLTMSVSLDRSGSVIEAQVLESTGNSRLDKMAIAIVQNGAPYGAFTEPMLKKFQILVVVSRFSFTRDNQLQTTVSSQQ
jgi:protein TonB